MKVSCSTCECWISADVERCRTWLLEHPEGHPTWRESLEMQQRQIWGSDLDRVLKKADDKRLRKLEKARKHRQRHRR